MKKPLRNKPRYIVDRQGTRWHNYWGEVWIAYDNFNGFYERPLSNPPVKLTGIWDQ